MRKNDYEEVAYMAIDTIKEELTHFARDDSVMFKITIDFDDGEKVEVEQRL